MEIEPIIMAIVMKAEVFFIVRTTMSIGGYRLASRFICHPRTPESKQQ